MRGDMYKVSPIPIKRRPRVTKSGHAYIDERTRDDLARVAAAYQGGLHDGPVMLDVYVYKSLPKSKKTPEPFTVKPDVDNVLKAVMDGLNGFAYHDDAQVIRATVHKLDRVGHTGEGVFFSVEPLETEKDVYGFSSKAD